MRTIGVGVDGSELSQHALRWAAAEARAWGAELEVVTVARDVALGPPEAMTWIPTEELVAEGEALQEVVLGAVDTGDVPVTRRVLVGHAGSALREVADAVDLLVVATRGMGTFAGLLLGSTAHHLAGRTGCPLVAVPGESRPPRRIVVGVDGSPHAQHALTWAVTEARRHDAHLELVASYEWLLPQPISAPYPAAPGLTTSSDRLRAHAEQVVRDASTAAGMAELSHEWTVVEGAPARRLLARAADADLLVVGSRGAGSAKGLVVGSVSHRVLHHAPVPVVVVP